MIRLLSRDGQIEALAGWAAAEETLRGATELLDIEIALPDSLDLTPARLQLAAGSLADYGLVRIQGVRAVTPASPAEPTPSRALAAMGEAAGLTFSSIEPKCLQEYEFLARFPGYADEWLGLTRTASTEFTQIVFTKKPRESAERRTKLAIITQDLYYSFIYESPALAGLFDTRKMEYLPFCAPEHYRSLLDFEPDALLVFRPDYLAPETFQAFKCPVIGYASEPLPRYLDGRVVASDYNRKVYDLLKKTQGLCTHLYHYDPAGIEFLRREGFPVAGLFPPCVCTDVYRPNPAADMRWDAVFIGKSTPYREKFLFNLHLRCNFFHGAHGLEGARDVLPFLQRAKIGLNIHRDETPNVEPRIPILMACGLLVLTQPLAENPWFVEDEHYATFSSETELADKVRYYLDHEDERRRIAENGRRWVQENANALVVLPRMIRQALRHE